MGEHGLHGLTAIVTGASSGIGLEFGADSRARWRRGAADGQARGSAGGGARRYSPHRARRPARTARRRCLRRDGGARRPAQGPRHRRTPRHHRPRGRRRRELLSVPDG